MSSIRYLEKWTVETFGFLRGGQKEHPNDKVAASIVRIYFTANLSRPRGRSMRISVLQRNSGGGPGMSENIGSAKIGKTLKVRQERRNKRQITNK